MRRVFNVVKNGPEYPRFTINEGIRAAGDIVESNVNSSDVVATWNNYGIARKLGEKIKDKGGKQIVFENGYLRRDQYYYAIGVNGYATLDERVIEKLDKSRFDKLDLKIPRWKRTGDYILICAQRGGGYSQLAMANHWPDLICSYVREFSDRPIVYKPHPGRTRLPSKTPANFTISTEPLGSLLKKAFITVVHTSNAGNESILAGVPVCTTSVLATMSKLACDVKYIEEPYYASYDERRLHFDNLANRQFNREEIASGLAWRTVLG